MKKSLLILLCGLVLKGVFAKCPSCPERAIKREAVFSKKEKKETTKRAASKRLQKKTIRSTPPISQAKNPFPSILKKAYKTRRSRL